MSAAAALVLSAVLAQASPAGSTTGWENLVLSETAAREILDRSGHWIGRGDGRIFLVRPRDDGSITVRAPWHGYRGRFIGHVDVDSVGRVAGISFEENWGRLTRSRRRRIREIEDPDFLAQYLGKSLGDPLDVPRSIRPPSASSLYHASEFGRVVSAIVIEALVVAREARQAGIP